MRNLFILNSQIPLASIPGSVLLLCQKWLRGGSAQRSERGLKISVSWCFLSLIQSFSFDTINEPFDKDYMYLWCTPGYRPGPCSLLNAGKELVNTFNLCEKGISKLCHNHTDMGSNINNNNHKKKMMKKKNTSFFWGLLYVNMVVWLLCR